ncbi:MAG: cation:proton antiporter [Sinobacteraceae bacterium]|nr:cation:proton antiporter [Nevskiaceae bacterium]
MQDHGAHLMLELFAMYAAAKLAAEVFTRLRQPAVVGEILAGVAVGPQVLGWVAPSETTHLLSELGVMFLMFGVGLETPPPALLRVGPRAAAVATLGVVVPFAAGWALMRLFGETGIQAAFVGAALVATSVGITARVLAELGRLETQTARIILGAAVIDDVLGLLVLAGVSSAASGALDWRALGFTAALALSFVAAVALIGAPALNRAAPGIARLHTPWFAVAVVLLFGLAWAAALIGVAAIIGAFLAGMALAEATGEEHALHQQVRGATELLVPFFLVNIGLQLDLHVFAQTQTLALALALTLVAVLTKLVGCGLGAWGLGWRGVLQIGVGMVPRGEVGIVVAQIGLALGVIGQNLFGAVLFMACATTLIAPPLLRPLYHGSPSR